MNDRLVATTIVEALGRNGALGVEALYKRVKKIHGDVGGQFYNKTLMTMELQGLIRVYSMSKEKRRVELARG